MGQIVEKRREGLVEASEVVSKPMQVDPREVESWARNPETALQHLATLLDALTQEDEDLLSWVTEALENCGVPDPSHISMLMERLPSTSSDVTYWAATLLGRMGEKAAVAHRPSTRPCSMAMYRRWPRTEFYGRFDESVVPEPRRWNGSES